MRKFYVMLLVFCSFLFWGLNAQEKQPEKTSYSDYTSGASPETEYLHKQEKTEGDFDTSTESYAEMKRRLWAYKTISTPQTPDDMSTNTKSFAPAITYAGACSGRTTIFNKGGGTNGSNGLRIIMTGAGNLQIYRISKQQIYIGGGGDISTSSGPYDVPGTINGIVISIGNTQYTTGTLKVENGFTKGGNMTVLSNTCPNEIGPEKGIQSNKIRLKVTKNNMDYFLNVTYTYIYPKDYFSVEYNMEIPQGNTETVKLAQGWDTYLGGSDNGPGFVNGQAPFFTMGTQKGGVYQAFQYISGIPWNGYYSARYGALNSNLSPNMIFKNTIDPNTGTDNGIGISIDFGNKPGSYTGKNLVLFSCNAPKTAPELTTTEASCGNGSLNLNKFIRNPTLPKGVGFIWRNAADGATITNPGEVKRTGKYTVAYRDIDGQCESPASTFTIRQCDPERDYYVNGEKVTSQEIFLCPGKHVIQAKASENFSYKKWQSRKSEGQSWVDVPGADNETLNLEKFTENIQYRILLSNNSNFNTDTGSQYINLKVNPTPSITSTGNKEYCSGTPGPALSVNTDSQNTVKWFDENNKEVGTGRDFTPSADGTYYAQAISPKGCPSEKIKLSVSPIQKPVITANPVALYCSGEAKPTLSVNTDDENTVKWFDKNNSEVGSGRNFIPSADGVYYAQATNTKGCRSEKIEFSVSPIQKPVITAQPVALYCFGEAKPTLSVSTDNKENVIKWFDENKNELGTGLSFTPSADGVYYAQATNTKGCHSEKVKFSVSPTQKPTITAQPVALYCFGETKPTLSVSTDNKENIVKWFDEHDNEVGTGLSFTPSSDGIYYAQATNTKGCRSEKIEFSVSPIQKPAITAEPVALYCFGEAKPTLSVNTDDENTVKWFDEYSHEIGTGLSFTPSADGIYYAQATNTKGCHSEKIKLTVYPAQNPTIAAKTIDTYCYGSSLPYLSVQTDLKNIVQWFDEDNNELGTGHDFTPLSEGVYYAEASNTAGCKSNKIKLSLEMYDFRLSKPLASCYKNLHIPEPKGGTPPYEYSINNIDYQKSPIFTNLLGNEQILYIRDQTCTIKEIIHTESLRIPKIISPNSDGINDVWDLSEILEACPDTRVKIFDRYQRPLQELHARNPQWDGSNYLGYPIPGDTYWYLIEFNDGVTPIFRGNITLKRNID